MKGYDHGLADCISQDSYNTVDMNHNAYNNNNDNNNPSPTKTNNQGQANTTTTTNPNQQQQIIKDKQIINEYFV